MILLLGVGFLAGVLTAISPCVLPVLPILLAGGAAGGRRRPYAIVAGLVLSFATFTLTTAWLIDRLGLPDDLLRNVALALLFVVAATLLHPRLGELAERPFLPLTRRRPGGLGRAPDFRRISHWLNTPGDRPLSLAGLRGKVVLVDFWTYSCINCLRTLPHLRAWDTAYRGDGLVIVGVHTPEFAFERDLSNVRGATKRLGVRYPVALDNGYGTWDAYSNQYWPAEYLIDRRGHVRHVHFGEGDYEGTERAIRSLLAVRAQAPPVADRTPTEQTTPESYLGYERLDRYAGSPVVQDREASYRFPARLGAGELAYAGRWRVEGQRIVAGRDARLRLRFRARNVFLVLGGRGVVRASVDGRPVGTVRVAADRLYTLVSGPRLRSGLLELRFSPGVEAYAFTFG